MNVTHETPRGGESLPKPVYFVADSHLGIESEAEERSKEDDLTLFLEALVGRAARLYLVGDIFDFWFEYPRVADAQHGRVIAALSRLSSSGTAIDFLGGNHDYWAGPRFEAATGATVHRHPLVATHFGRTIFIAHGDGLPAGDRGYRLLKAVIRSRPAIGCFRLIPPRAGSAIARWASGLSDITEERIARALPPMQAFIRRKLGEGFDAVVVGHVHRQQLFESENGAGVIIGDWMSARSVIELGPAGFRALRWGRGRLQDAASTEDCAPA